MSNSSDPTTRFLGLTKPIVNDEAGEDLWGDKLNVNFDLIDDFAAAQGVLTEAPEDGKYYLRGERQWLVGNTRAEYDTLSNRVTTNEGDIAAVELVNVQQNTAISGKAQLGPNDGSIYGWRNTGWFQLAGTSFTIDWSQITGTPATYPPTLPIPSSGVTGLDTKQASQDAAIAAINWNSLSSKPATFPPTLPIPSSGVTGLDTKQASQDASIATKLGDAPNDGAQYARQSATWSKVTGGAIVSDNAPVGALPSSFWWESNTGALFINFEDANSTQFVQVNAAGMPEAPVDAKSYVRRNASWYDIGPTIAAMIDATELNTALGNYLPITGGSLSGAVSSSAAISSTVNVSGSYAMVATNQNTGGGGIIGYSGATYGILGYSGYSLYGTGAVYAAGAGTFGGQVTGANLVTQSNLSFSAIPNMVFGYGNDTTWTITSGSHFQFAYSGTVRHRLETSIWRCLVDATCALGTGSYRFSTVYASTGTINTSDERLKQDIQPLTEAEKRVAVALRGLIVTYRLIASVEEKGEEARIHTGIIAQRVQEAFAAEGLDVARYGLWCADEEVVWHSEVIEEIDGVPTKVKEGYEEPTGFTRYSIRYEELLCFIIGGL